MPCDRKKWRDRYGHNDVIVDWGWSLYISDVTVHWDHMMVYMVHIVNR